MELRKHVGVGDQPEKKPGKLPNCAVVPIAMTETQYDLFEHD